MGKWLSVGDVLRVLAVQTPDREGAADLSRSLTFKQWNERCCRLANGLLDLGLAKGDRIGFLAHNCLEWLEYYGAAAKNGLVCVPVLFRLTPQDFRYILEDCEARAFLVADDFVEAANSVRDQLPHIEHWIYVGPGPVPPGYVGYEELMARGSAAEPPVEVHHDDVWTIMYTSGTTGRPKGVVRTHASYIAFYLLNIVSMGFGREDRGLLVMPMSHVNSIYYSFTFTYCGGAAIVYDRTSFDPEHLLGTLRDCRITFTSLVPTHYIMILSLPDAVKKSYDVSCVRKLLCSSAPARRDTKLGILDFFKQSQLYEAYGSTEAALVTLLTPDMQFEKLGSVGREIPGTDLVKLLGEDGREVPTGEVGELYSRSPACFREYWKRPEETRAAFRGEWFSAGDMAYRDEDGYYYLVDRKKNMIITGGENVYPSEVEDAIGAHPAVKDVAVVGVPDAKWGERVTAVIVLRDGHEPGPALGREIQDFCKDKMAGYKRPKDVHFIPDPEMPRTATGKILHRKLREKYGHWSEK